MEIEYLDLLGGQVICLLDFLDRTVCSSNTVIAIMTVLAMH